MKILTEILWGDRFLWFNAAAAFAFVFGLNWWTSNWLPEDYPSVERLRMRPDKHQGKRVWCPPRPVSRAGEGEFEITDDGVPIRIVAPGTWTEGEWVFVRGTFRGESVIADAVRRLPHYRLKRTANYAVSLALLAVVAALFFRIARPSLEKGLFVSRY